MGWDGMGIGRGSKMKDRRRGCNELRGRLFEFCNDFLVA